MLSYLFIEETFKAILQKSKAIQGRFLLCPKMGTEINSEEFDQVIKDQVKVVKGSRYPVCLCMPPTSHGVYKHKQSGWERYQITLFFLKQTYVNANNSVQSPNVNTKTSQHTVPMDWHDMRRAAEGFLRVLEGSTRSAKSIKINHEYEVVIRPVSFVGVDRLAGVEVHFTVAINSGVCEVEDYDSSDIDGIELPTEDSHPEHKM